MVSLPHPQPLVPRLWTGCVRTHVYTRASGWAMNGLVIAKEMKLQFCLQKDPRVEESEGTSLTRTIPSRSFLIQNRAEGGRTRLLKSGP